MDYKELCYEIIDNHDNIVYATDMQTNEVIFANKKLLQVIGKTKAEVFGKPCYQALQDKEKPCEFCTNAILLENKCYDWEIFRDDMQRYFILHDNLLVLGDRKLRVEVGTDITDQVLEKREIKNKLNMEKTLIKCIAVASGNDAAVAMAEYVCGSEEAFVTKMNEKAQSLGMTNTHFTDCCGLTDDDSHHTTARDVAIMSRELVQKYPDIYQYTGIWMEDITHTTARGSTPFTLSSTNKLLKQYQWATGLKTGSTAKAKYCLSATARKDGIDLITVVMTAPDSRARFLDAATLFSYGYSVSALYRDDNKDQLLPVPVKGGQEETVPVVYASEFVWLDTDGNDISMVQKRISVPKEAEAPVVAGTKAGEAIYRLNGEQIGTVPILYASNVEKAFYRDYVKKAVTAFLL